MEQQIRQLDQVEITIYKKSDSSCLVAPTHLNKKLLGMELIEMMQRAQAAPSNKHYNVYKDHACQQPITYIDLTLTLQQLNFSSNQVLWATLDDMPNYGAE